MRASALQCDELSIVATLVLCAVLQRNSTRLIMLHGDTPIHNALHVIATRASRIAMREIMVRQLDAVRYASRMNM